MSNETIKEHSAGGVIFENGLILLIMMQNLKGEKVWTFPKGHLEPGETPQAAALREVAEETGYECQITGEIFKANYSFIRSGRFIEKDVQWYAMKKTGGDGKPRTPEEIFDIRWCPIAEARKLIIYPSDHKILDLLERTGG